MPLATVGDLVFLALNLPVAVADQEVRSIPWTCEESSAMIRRSELTMFFLSGEPQQSAAFPFCQSVNEVAKGMILSSCCHSKMST